MKLKVKRQIKKTEIIGIEKHTTLLTDWWNKNCGMIRISSENHFRWGEKKTQTGRMIRRSSPVTFPFERSAPFILFWRPLIQCKDRCSREGFSVEWLAHRQMAISLNATRWKMKSMMPSTVRHSAKLYSPTRSKLPHEWTDEWMNVTWFFYFFLYCR